MIYGYVRVSSDKQTTENQIFEINRFAKKNNLKINRWVNETISGLKELNKRKLGKLLKSLKKGDILITSELSRLGRNLLQVMSILSYCMEREISVWTIKDNYRLGTDVQSKILAFAFSLSAEIERNLISQRTKEALARLKSEGKILGRPLGSCNKQYKLSGQEKELRDILSKEISMVDIAETLKVSPKTIRRFVRKHKKTQTVKNITRRRFLTKDQINLITDQN